MALDQCALLEVLEALKAADVDDRIRTATETLYQALIEAELTAVIGAAPHERTDARTAQRNGSRPRTLSTTAGDLELRIPKLRAGSFFPSLLERRRRIDQALFAVVMEAYLHGVSTRKVDDLGRELGADTGISKSEVSRICADLDAEVAAFRDRSLAEQAFPYVFLDATYCKARVNRRVVSQAVVIATGVAADGHRGGARLRRRRQRGRRLLDRVPAHAEDPRAGRGAAGHLRCPHRAEGRDRRGAAGRGLAVGVCRVHFMRNVLARVPKGNAEMVAAAIRTIFAQPDAEHVRSQLDVVAGMLGRQFPGGSDAAGGRRGPAGLHRLPDRALEKIWSTNPLERLNKEIKRRTDVIGVFPNPDALLRLAGAVLVEAHDEWQVSDRRYLSEGSMAAIRPIDATPPLAAPPILTPPLAAPPILTP
jgi:putative transposase